MATETGFVRLIQSLRRKSLKILGFVLVAGLLLSPSLFPGPTFAWGNGPELFNPLANPSAVPLGAQPQESPLILSVEALGPGGQIAEVITNLEGLIGAMFYHPVSNSISDVQMDNPLFRVYQMDGADVYLVEVGIRHEYNMYRKAVTHELLRGEAVATDKWQVELPLAGNLPGSHCFRVIARNTVHHEGYAWISLDIVEDSVKPEVSAQAKFAVNSLQTCIGDCVTIEVEATDDSTGVFSVRIEDEGARALFGESAELMLVRQAGFDIWSVQNTVAQNVLPGVYEVRVAAMDRAGNESVKTVRITVADKINSFVIDLKKGWNLISVPRRLENPSTEAVFEGLSVSGVRTMIGGEWIEAAEITPGLGYLVEASEGATLVLKLSHFEVSSLPQAIDLGRGWNLIGYASPTLEPVVPLNFYLGEEMKDKWTILRDADGAEARARSTSPYVWATDSFPTITGAPSFSDVTDNIPVLEMGEGYWIFLVDDAVLLL